MSLVLDVVAPPKPAAIKRRAAMATAAFLRPHQDRVSADEPPKNAGPTAGNASVWFWHAP